MSLEGAQRRESRPVDALYGPDGSRRGSSAEVRRNTANRELLAAMELKRELVKEGSPVQAAAGAPVDVKQ